MSVSGSRDANRPLVFLSHSSKNKQFVQILATALDANGFASWMYEGEIPVGNAFPKDISDALDRSAYFIAAHSQDFVKSSWSQQELYAALALEKNGKIKKVILARLDDTPIPSLLQANVYADFRGDIDTGLRKILLALEVSPDKIVQPAVKRPASEPRLMATLEQASAYQLTTIFNRVPNGYRRDNQNLSEPTRIQILLQLVKELGGIGIEGLARIVVDLYPATESTIYPFL